MADFDAAFFQAWSSSLPADDRQRVAEALWDARPTSVVVSIPADTTARATTGLEVLTQVWPSGLVTADVRPAKSGAVWTPIAMAGGDVEMRP